MQNIVGKQREWYYMKNLDDGGERERSGYAGTAGRGARSCESASASCVIRVGGGGHPVQAARRTRLACAAPGPTGAVLFLFFFRKNDENSYASTTGARDKRLHPSRVK